MKKHLMFLILLSTSLFAKEHFIDQKNKEFAPGKITVKVGDTLVFKNSDGFAHHTYTDDERNEFDSGLQTKGNEVKVKVNASGKFIVECAIHPNMLLEVNAQ